MEAGRFPEFLVLKKVNRVSLLILGQKHDPTPPERTKPSADPRLVIE